MLSTFVRSEAAFEALRLGTEQSIKQKKMSKATGEKKPLLASKADKGYTSFDTRSVNSEYSIDQEKAQAQPTKKPSLGKRIVEVIKNIEPPEPRIPEGRHHVPGWAR